MFSDDSEGFVSISEVIPDVLLDIRYYSTFNFIGERVDGYMQPVALLTKEASECLKEVSDELNAEGYRLKVFDAYRPQMAVDHFIRGSTVDLTLFDMRTQKEMDMGSPFDFFGSCSHTDYHGISKEQHMNRLILRKAMLAHGFRSLQTEWWHFTLKNEPYPDTFFTFPVRSL